MRILVQEICPCVISSRASFFSYEKLGWITTMFYSVQETWSHVIETFCFLYNISLLVVISCFKFFVFLAILLIIDCYPEKNKIWNSLSSVIGHILGPSAISFIIIIHEFLGDPSLTQNFRATVNVTYEASVCQPHLSPAILTNLLSTIPCPDVFFSCSLAYLFLCGLAVCPSQFSSSSSRSSSSSSSIW